MNKVICKYINNCALCKREKGRIQVYPLQMIDIPDRSFEKIAIHLVPDINASASGIQHILTIIDHLTGCSDVLQSLTKKQTPVFMF